MENEMEMKILEFHPTREETGGRGDGENRGFPGNRGPGWPPARPPLAGRRTSKPRVDSLRFLEIRHAFVAKRPKCAPFSTQILDKRQVL